MNQNYKTAFYISLVANFLFAATIAVMCLYMTPKTAADELEPVPEIEIVPSDTDADELFVTPTDVSETDVSETDLDEVELDETAETTATTEYDTNTTAKQKKTTAGKAKKTQAATTKATTTAAPTTAAPTTTKAKPTTTTAKQVDQSSIDNDGDWGDFY